MIVRGERSYDAFPSGRKALFSLPNTLCQVRFLPFCLAKYIWTSAASIISSILSGGFINVDTPILNVTGHPLYRTSSKSFFLSFPTTWAADSAPVSANKIPNSSPPNRTITSIARILFFIVLATKCKSLSPTGCPKVSDASFLLTYEDNPTVRRDNLHGNGQSGFRHCRFNLGGIPDNSAFE